jgi:hypothetical protein
VPWHHFQSPALKWATQPSFLVGEWMFVALAVLALVHAARTDRRHLLVWVGALVAGTANDLFFMALPLVDNFWQAQATVMITARLPLYIPCVYVCFMYYPTVAVWRLGLPLVARAPLTGLAAIAFYAPYDVVGAKLLWWTWHDTDRPIANRLLGAPIGSSMWVITFVAVFSFWVGRVTDRDPEVKPRTFAKGLALVAGLSTVLMMVQLTALQQLDGGVPGIRGLCVLVAIYGGLVVWRSGKREPKEREPDGVLGLAIPAYFAVLLALGAVSKPEQHRSTSVHQTYGPCHVEAKDIAGLTRYQYVCREDFEEEYTFDCPGGVEATDGASWYTVCGTPHRNFQGWIAGLAAMCVVGMGLYARLFRVGRAG